MQLGAEHAALRETVRGWIARDINPHVDAWEEAGIFPAHEVFGQMGALGLLGITKPEEFGGQGLDYSYGAVLAEELAGIRCGGVPMAIGVQTDMCTPALAKHGSDALRRDYLAPAIDGTAVGCLGVSEPGAGSDVAGIRTVARRDGDDYVISGEKMWTTNGTQADFCCLLASTSAGDPHRNKSLIVVPMDAKGVSLARKIDKQGMHASDTAQLFFDEVRVPVTNLIGEEGMGFVYQMEQFQYERLWVALNTGRALQRAIDATIEYTAQRSAFGQRLLDQQYIQYRLAEMQTEVEALHALSWRGVEEAVAGRDATRLATMAKLKAGRLARSVADECLQFWGGMGYAAESEINRLARDVRLTAIGGGADEVMMQILARMEILPKAPRQ